MKWVIYNDSLCSIITWNQNCYKLVTMVTFFIFPKLNVSKKVMKKVDINLSLNDNAGGAHWSTKAMRSKCRHSRHIKEQT